MASTSGDFRRPAPVANAGRRQQIINTLTVNNTQLNDDGSVLYFGLIAGGSNELFRSIKFLTTSGSGDVFGFDNFTIADLGQVGPPIPEPATLTLVASGLLGIGDFGCGASRGLTLPSNDDGRTAGRFVGSVSSTPTPPQRNADAHPVPRRPASTSRLGNRRTHLPEVGNREVVEAEDIPLPLVVRNLMDLKSSFEPPAMRPKYSTEPSSLSCVLLTVSVLMILLPASSICNWSWPPKSPMSMP